MRLRSGKIIHRFNVHAKEFKPNEPLSGVQPTESSQKAYIDYLWRQHHELIVSLCSK